MHRNAEARIFRAKMKGLLAGIARCAVRVGTGGVVDGSDQGIGGAGEIGGVDEVFRVDGEEELAHAGLV